MDRPVEGRRTAGFSAEPAVAMAPATPMPYTVVAGDPGRDAGRSWLRRTALYPQAYAWYILLSAVDLIFTRVILHVGGREVNAVADWIFDKHDVAGVVIFKFALVVTVVLICEIIGRRDFERGLKLARWAVALSLFPVLVGAFHLLSLSFGADDA